MPRGGLSIPPPSTLCLGHSLHGAHGLHGAQVVAAHEWGAQEAGSVAVAVGGVRIRVADAAGCVTPRGGHDVAHLDTRGRRSGDTRRGTLYGFAQLVSRVAGTA